MYPGTCMFNMHWKIFENPWRHRASNLAAFARDGAEVESVGQVRADDTHLLSVADLHVRRSHCKQTRTRHIWNCHGCTVWCFCFLLTPAQHSNVQTLLHATELALRSRLHVDLAVALVPTLEREVVAIVTQEERLQHNSEWRHSGSNAWGDIIHGRGRTGEGREGGGLDPGCRNVAKWIEQSRAG